ncbi:MAG: GHKL domain-containing protein [Cyclobacteriaceae bacterium]|nr:GHKL domain-containing protein [Cyclobacteriaceae bacterium]
MKVRHWLLFALAVALVASGLFARRYQSQRFYEGLTSVIEANLSSELKRLEKEAEGLLAVNLDLTSREWETATHFFAHADSNGLIRWNRNDFIPDLGSLPAVGEIAFLQNSRGDFLIKKWPTNNNTMLVGMTTLSDRYAIVNSFLSPQVNKEIFPIDVRFVQKSDGFGLPVRFDNEVVFHIATPLPEIREGAVSFALLLLALIAFVAALIRLEAFLQTSYSYDISLLVLFAGLLGLRFSMIAINWPALYFPSQIFDPRGFASSALNVSIGDLFLNSLALMVVVLYLFRHFEKFSFTQWALRQSGLLRWALGLICLLACFYALLFPFNFIETIYHNSSLSLEIRQSLVFSPVRILAIASVLLGCIASFLFLHVFFLLAGHLFNNSTKWFSVGLASAVVIFFLQYFLSAQDHRITLIVGLLFFSFLHLTRLYRVVFRFSFQLFIYIVVSWTIFSLQNALSTKTFFEERQEQSQIRFAREFLTGRDILGEYLLSQARDRIQSDQFIRAIMAGPFVNRSVISDKIRRVHLSSYFDRYEIRISTFVQSTSQDSLRNEQSGLSPTGYEGVYFSEPQGTTALRHYRMSVPIASQRYVGSIELDLTLKRIIPESVYPELLVDNRFNQAYSNRDFSYAIFSEKSLLSSFGSFNYDRFADQLQSKELFESGIVLSSYSHIASLDDRFIMVVSSPAYSWFNVVSEFSFWFVLGLIVVLVGQSLSGGWSLVQGRSLNYSSRIQLVVFLSFLLPILAVSITTLTLINRSNEESIQRDFLARSLVLSQQVPAFFGEGEDQLVDVASLEKWVEENASASTIDVSVYSPEGKLLASSQPELFSDQLVSTQINPEAWRSISLQSDRQIVTSEKIGGLQYSCAYSAVLQPESGKLLAIVALPFFESASVVQKSQSLILANILIVFVIVFIVFSFLSFWASRSLTFPIRFITRALRQTSFSGDSARLEWSRSDEIGTVVNEYNRMLTKVEESKKALAQSEKESAWREMAKQVAHEIKNPLTPMKLTLQQMQQSLEQGELSIEKSQKSVDVLLKQVNILNDIASSFSTLASMPMATPERTDLIKLIQQTATLFATSDGIITTRFPNGPVEVTVDPKSFSRALSNLIINALQAKRDNQERVEVSIACDVSSDSILITIQDNGKGIPRSDYDQIFQPKFTTKQSGSGLGLVMVKQVVQQTGGSVWFESEEGVGTAFYVKLQKKV